MHQRCSSKSHPAYSYYHGRGISVCPEWTGRLGYDQFFDDMGEPPLGLTLERKDNNMGYSKANCVWATWAEQAANRRKTGPKPNPDCLAQKARMAGLPYPRVYQRIFINGWSEDEALTTPIQPRGKYERWK